MPSRLTLTLPHAFGENNIEVEVKRFSIGRTPDNDLSLEDQSLSRRHALIEDIDGHFVITDCGSSNGTFVNNVQINSPTELSDWDMLTFGSVSDVLVRIEDGQQPASSLDRVHEPINFKPIHPQNKAESPKSSSSITTLIVAGSAALIVLFVTGIVLLLVYLKTPSITNGNVSLGNRNGNSNSGVSSDETPSPLPSADGNTQSDSGPKSNEALDIEEYAAKVLKGISRDTHPVITEKPLSEISKEVRDSNGAASVQEEIRSMKRALPAVSAIAKANGIRTPLAIFATLATIDKNGGRGDPVQVAGAVCPALARMRSVFGDELANDSLLTVAALEEGPGLQFRITKLAGRVTDSPTTIRSIWYLHDHEVISDRTYNFILRFMALGVIAQDPRKFAIDADPLVQ